MDQGGETTACSLATTMWRVSVRLAHEVEHAVLGLHVEVEIDFGAPVVQMARHGVPDAARFERSEPEQQLRGLAHVRVNVLVDRALVRGVQRAELHGLGLVDRDLHRLEARMRRRADEIEPGGRRGIRRTRTTTLALPIADIQAVARFHRIGRGRRR